MGTLRKARAYYNLADAIAPAAASLSVRTLSCPPVQGPFESGGAAGYDCPVPLVRTRLRTSLLLFAFEELRKPKRSRVIHRKLLLDRFPIAPQNIGARRFPDAAPLDVKKQVQLPWREDMASHRSADQLLNKQAERGQVRAF